jgi:hypothetical protein
MEGVITAAGHTLPSFAGYGGEREGAPFGRPFAGGAEMTSLVQEALVRLRSAIDVANEACEGKQSLDFWTGARTLNWILGNNTSTASVCTAAANMQVAYDYYAERVADPSTTDEQLADILVGINKNADVRDLIALAEATGAEAAARLAASATRRARRWKRSGRVSSRGFRGGRGPAGASTSPRSLAGSTRRRSRRRSDRKGLDFHAAREHRRLARGEGTRGLARHHG